MIREIQEKERRVREFLKARDLQALLLKRQANFSWMTGGGLNVVGTATELGNASLLITENGKFVIANNIEAPRMVEEEKLEDQGYQVRSYPWYEEREAALVREIVGKGKVGCDWAFPETEMVAGEVARLRYSLTPTEVVRYRWLGARVSASLEQTMIGVERGEKESAVIGRLCRELWKDRIDTMGMMGAADERIARFRHCIPTEKPVQKILMVSVNARKGGLIVCLTRFVHFGKVPAELRERYEANVYVDCVLMAATRPGVPAREVLEKGIAAYAAKGYPEEWKLHHQGGSIGYAPRDYRVNFETEDIVQENQGFAWNPSITGTKSEDTILATAQGAELITKPVFYPALSCEAVGSTFVRPNILEKD
ncbi:MAG: M24 family metallopeptidase [Deltaproteobacteria bacterium]|nr:M24 family metallopeptidase [Deltaproteobacteria bacterium]